VARARTQKPAKRRERDRLASLAVQAMLCVHAAESAHRGDHSLLARKGLAQTSGHPLEVLDPLFGFSFLCVCESFFAEISGFPWECFHVLMQYMNKEQKVTCPKCQSDLTIEIPGAGKRCQACAFQWNVSKNPIADAVATRKLQGVVGWKREPK